MSQTQTSCMPLQAAIATIRASVEKNPKSGNTTFVVRGEGQGLVGSRVKAGRHVLLIDEPPMLAGENVGPSPVETLLAALIGCQIATYRAYAAAMEIQLDSISITAEGDFDVRGSLAIDDTVRPGFSAIRLKIKLEGPESEAKYQTLQEVVDAHCPVHDMVSNGVPITSEIHKAEIPA